MRVLGCLLDAGCPCLEFGVVERPGLKVTVTWDHC